MASGSAPGVIIIFFHKGLAQILNLQPRPGGEAKPYQVRQVREVILKYGLAAVLGGKEESE